MTLEHFETTLPEYPLEEYARTYPFRYSDEDFPNLARALAPHYPAEGVAKWALQFLDPSDSTDTMKMLRAMTRGIRDAVHLHPPRRERRADSRRDAARAGGAVAVISRCS